MEGGRGTQGVRGAQVAQGAWEWCTGRGIGNGNGHRTRVVMQAPLTSPNALLTSNGDP